MSYTYGTKGAPAVGGAPGLPQRIQAAESTYTRIVSGEGILVPPQNALFMRVAVIGGGGGGNGTTAADWVCGGGGGGCAASKIVAASPISYLIGAGGPASAAQAGNTTAAFLSYLLVGQGGFGGNSTGALGGTGYGGDYNFSGGNGLYVVRASSDIASTGAGAAGPNGNGGNGGGWTDTTTKIDPTSGVFTGTGWGSGGGGGGNFQLVVSVVIPVAPGGGGTGANGGYKTDAVGQTNAVGSTIWGTSPGPLEGDSSTAYSSAGGEMGGGGGAAIDAGTVLSESVGGSGGMVVEWFY